MDEKAASIFVAINGELSNSPLESASHWRFWYSIFSIVFLKEHEEQKIAFNNFMNTGLHKGCILPVKFAFAKKNRFYLQDLFLEMEPN